MNKETFLKTLELGAVTIIDRQGNTTSTEDLKQFISRAMNPTFSVIGRETYLVSDSGQNQQAYGLDDSFVVVLSIRQHSLTASEATRFESTFEESTFAIAV